jgi:hypothetical protein
MREFAKATGKRGRGMLLVRRGTDLVDVLFNIDCLKKKKIRENNTY